MKPLQIGMKVKCALSGDDVLSYWFEGTIKCIHEGNICVERNEDPVLWGNGCKGTWKVYIHSINDRTFKILVPLPQELKDKDRVTKDNPITLEEIAFYRWESCKNGVTA